MPILNIDAKACPRCKQTLPLSFFGRNPARKDKVDVYCKSCRREKYRETSDRQRFESHGMCNTFTYRVWADMKTRCRNPKHKGYPNYGGRGITYVDEWEFFSNFFRDMGERPEGLTLERIDNEKGYSKDNCCWATRADQNRNKRGCKNYKCRREEESFDNS